MSEVWFMTCGGKAITDEFETFMQTHKFAMQSISPNGEIINTNFFGRLDPVKLYRYVLPKAGVGLILKTLGADVKPKHLPTPVSWAIRKGLGLREVKKEEVPYVGLPMPDNVMKNLQIEFLGVKDEEARLMYETGVKQEPI